MSKTIMVITGSPRTKGNTFAMVDAFTAAAQAKGYTVKRFDAALSNVGGCQACMTCYSTGDACTFDDDFNTVAEDILTADGIVFAAPVYWYTFPGQIKNVIDKMFSFYVGGKPITGKDVAIIACCEEGDVTIMEEGMVKPMQRACGLLKWNMVGTVLMPGVYEEGAVAKTDGCAQAAALADKF